MATPLPLLDPEVPLGQKGQRGAVLLQLKRARELTAKDLAGRLGLSLNAVRHHLKELEIEGFVAYQRENRGVGAPVFVYRLSPAGESLFPRRYGQALTAMLDHVVEREGREAAVVLLESYFGALARRLRTDLVGTSPGERLMAVARALSEEGYMAEGTAESSAGAATLTEHNCALPAVAERFPEICAAEARFLAEVLGARVDRREHILSGCPACEYHVRFGTEGKTEEKA
ncbi:MAG TPA: helix-turn-helix domain-containing protein [Gemmatimonadales bacterium]|jgi:DeoR family transcriptional regulator, suf operon transcriptional repressor|nr:helix-turn-helix domain-containing protein [Gemmatimonadales bacterium]